MNDGLQECVKITQVVKIQKIQIVGLARDGGQLSQDRAPLNNIARTIARLGPRINKGQIT